MAATLGIIKLDSDFARFPGDPGNPATFDVPVLYETLSGATAERVTGPGDDFLKPVVAAGLALAARGADAVLTTCGFLVAYQGALAAALPVPVATSTLLQIPHARALIGPDREVGVLTFNESTLGPKHLAAAGAPAGTPVAGLKEDGCFRRDILGGKPASYEERREDALEALDRLMMIGPRIGAVVVECTNIAPYSADLRERSGLPVFDIVTLARWLAAAVRPARYPSHPIAR